MFNVGDRFRVKDTDQPLPYGKSTLEIVSILTDRKRLYLVRTSAGEEFKAHFDWLTRYWRKLDERTD